MNYYLENVLIIIKYKYNQLISFTNDVKLRIRAFDKQRTDFFMACTTAISSVANTIIKFHIQYDFYFVYKKNLYHDKQNIMDEMFHQFHLPLLKDADHPVLSTEWKQNIDSTAYENNMNKEIKQPSKKKEIDRQYNMTYCPTSIKEVIGWFTFLNIMAYTEDRV